MSANLSLKTSCLHTLSAFADVLCRHKMQTKNTAGNCRYAYVPCLIDLKKG